MSTLCALLFCLWRHMFWAHTYSKFLHLSRLQRHLLTKASIECQHNRTTTAYTEVINPIKHMSATLNYRKYVTPSLSIYPWFSLYSRAHIIKGIWVPLPPCSLALLCHRHRRPIIMVVELVRLALTKGYQIWLVLSSRWSIRRQLIDLLLTNRRGSSFG